jgi:DNA-binding transcriptional LysR family regulator
VPQDLQLDWLRAFVTTVDAGSLSAAAPQLFRSQSAVSIQIRKLEGAIGQPVLSRGPRHLELTPAGLKLIGHARRILEAHGDAVADLTGEELKGHVRAGVPDDFAQPYFTPALRNFGAKHPSVDIELNCEQSTMLLPKVMRGELDIALLSRIRPRVGTLLREEPLVWVGSPKHEAWRRRPLPLAVYETGSPARMSALQALRRRRMTSRIVCGSASVAGQLVAVESGLAIAALTRCSVPAHLQVLDERHGLPPMPAVQLVLVRSKASVSSLAVDAIWEELMRTASAQPSRRE